MDRSEDQNNELRPIPLKKRTPVERLRFYSHRLKTTNLEEMGPGARSLFLVDVWIALEGIANELERGE